MMHKGRFIRILLLFSTTGMVWLSAMRLLFITSGAQRILASPQHQSNKFLKTFTEYEPLPRMASDGNLLLKGFFICGLFAAGAFLFVNSKMTGGWLKRGSVFGLVHAASMIPWFEFYLPYNVMNEPIPLVLLEGLLWLVTLQLTGLWMSFVINFRSIKK
ncbi:MAG: hypothetical protein JWQ38_2663 [Flavipsychrobacter sp.]|nr:hypothetical protein [Flavipsychrobacter sp.]